MGTWFHADGRKEEVRPEKGKNFSLEEVQKYVGGYFAIYRTFEDGSMLLVCEDEGFNPHAITNVQAWMFAAGKMHCAIENIVPILGDALYCTKGEIE